MKTEDKKQSINLLTRKLLLNSFDEISNKIAKALNSGALDLENWDKDSNPMILPKIILIALLEEEAEQYKAIGTSFEKQVKKEVKNLKLFI